MGCAVCGGRVPAKERGRPAVYCSRGCQAKAYRARKAGKADGEDAGTPAGAMSAREAARRAAFHAAAVIESALASGWETLDRYGPDRPRVEAALSELHAELDRRAHGRHRPGREESPERVTEPAPPAASRDENLVAVTETGAAPTPDGRPDRDDRRTGHEPPPPIGEPGDGESYEEEAERERLQFQRRLKPVPEFGEGYQMAEWPGTGRYHLVFQGQRIGHAVKKTFTSRWEAHSAHGPQIPGTGTYSTRREALIQVALHHRHTQDKRTRRR